MRTLKPRLWAYSLPAALALLAPINLFPSLGMDIYLPIVPLMPTILQTTPDVVQMTLTLYMIALGVGQIVFGPMSDKYGRRPILVAGVLVFAAASLALATTSSALVFIGLRLVQAVGASAMLVALFATIRDVYADKPESATIYSLMNAMLAFVPALGPILGVIISETLGWRAIFVALGVPALIALLFVLPRWHETQPPSSQMSVSFIPVLSSPSFWTYTLAFSAAMGTFFVFFSSAPRVLIETAGYTELEFSLTFATAALVMIATTRFAKHFVERWGIAGSAVRGMILLLIGAGLLTLGEVYLAPSFLSFVLPMWVMSIGIVLTTSVTANGALQEFASIAGTAVALHFCVQSIIVGVIGTGFVILLDGSTAWPLVGFSTVIATVTLVALLVLHKGQLRLKQA